MFISLRGTQDGREDDPIFFIPSSPVDAPILQGPLSKDRREDIQMFSFALALSLALDDGHPIDIRRGDDPPDRVVHVGGVPYAVELTELTITDVRRELAQARRLGRLLHERLTREAAQYTHLMGRRVVLAILPADDGLPRDTAPLLDQLSQLLKEDRGCVGDGVDLTNGPPDHWPNNRGYYGQHGPVNLMTYGDGIAHHFLVSSNCQTEVRLSQTLQTINDRIVAKDSAASNVLLMSCGMPDERGFACPIDRYMFQFIQENADPLQLSPAYLSGVFL
ncbi:MAG TPA: hypothetical protein VHG93_10800, partial [Longimicrobium sp.]|nr:hypothetical protein [Longimicrobium sp.]